MNVLLGTATASLVAWLAWGLFRRRDAALIAGAIYAVHPANIENYVWIAGLSHALAAFWMLTSLIFGLASMRDKAAAGSLRLGLASLVTLLLALLSKENAAVTPILLFAMAISLEGVARRTVAAKGARIIWPKWVQHRKGKGSHGEDLGKCRFGGMESATERRGDLFAGTPPLLASRLLVERNEFQRRRERPHDD